MDAAGELLALLAEQPPGHVPPYLRAHLARGRGAAGRCRGRARRTSRIELSGRSRACAPLGYPYWLARTQTDLAAWLIDRGRDAEAERVLAEAIATLSHSAPPRHSHAHAEPSGPARSVPERRARRVLSAS